MKNLKRTMALVLCIVMMLSLVPAITPTAEAASDDSVDSRGLSIGYNQYLPWVINKKDMSGSGGTITAYLYAMDSGYRITTNRLDQSNTVLTGEHVQYYYWPETPWKNNNGQAGTACRPATLEEIYNTSSISESANGGFKVT